MALSEDVLLALIDAHIETNNGTYSDWYVGITEDPEQRKQDHNVTDGDNWFQAEAKDEQVARKIEEYFQEEKGTDGGGGGGKEPTWVYTYEKSRTTKESLES